MRDGPRGARNVGCLESSSDVSDRIDPHVHHVDRGRDVVRGEEDVLRVAVVQALLQRGLQQDVYGQLPRKLVLEDVELVLRAERGREGRVNSAGRRV